MYAPLSVTANAAAAVFRVRPLIRKDVRGASKERASTGSLPSAGILRSASGQVRFLLLPGSRVVVSVCMFPRA